MRSHGRSGQILSCPQRGDSHIVFWGVQCLPRRGELFGDFGILSGPARDSLLIVCSYICFYNKEIFISWTRP